MSRISTTIATSRLLWRAFIRGKPHIAYAGGWLGHHDLGDEALFHADGKLFNNASLMLYPHDDNRAVSAYKKFHGNFLMGLLAFAAAILYLAVL